MSQDNPTTDVPVTPKRPKEINKTEEHDALPDEALDKVIGGDVLIQPRGSNG